VKYSFSVVSLLSNLEDVHRSNTRTSVVDLHRIRGRLKPFLSRLTWKWRRRSSVRKRSESLSKDRKHYSAEEKVAVLRRHLLDILNHESAWAPRLILEATGQALQGEQSRTIAFAIESLQAL
jgi:hypothetical protein